MRLIGYCTRCRRIKPVRVTGRSGPGHNVVMGVCRECDEKRGVRKS